MIRTSELKIWICHSFIWNRDAIIISVLDTFTSLLAGCVIFSVLGAMANEKGVEIKDVVTSGMQWIWMNDHF